MLWLGRKNAARIQFQFSKVFFGAHPFGVHSIRAPALDLIAFLLNDRLGRDDARFVVGLLVLVGLGARFARPRLGLVGRGRAIFVVGRTAAARRRCLDLGLFDRRHGDAEPLQPHLLLPLFDAVPVPVQIAMLIEYQGDARRILAVRLAQRRRGVHLVLGALDEHAAVLEGDANAAHLRVLEALQVVVDLADLADGLRLHDVGVDLVDRLRRGDRRRRQRGQRWRRLNRMVL